MAARVAVAGVTDSSSAADHWGDLKPGDHVEIYRLGAFVGRGEIDGKTADSSVIWVLLHGTGRAMFHFEDGVSAVVGDRPISPKPLK